MNLKKHHLLELFCFFILLFGSVKNSISQIDETNGKIVAFHPSVGISINLSEKKEFAIFTEYNDSLFESAQLVKYSIDNYSVLIKTTKGQSFEKPISIQELDGIYASIEKIKQGNVVAPNTSTDDYVEGNHPKEKEFKKHKSETAYYVTEITIQILFVFLEFLAQSY